VASMALDMGDVKAEPYPLADALEDAYFWMMFQRAMEHPGEEIRSEKMPWHEGR